MHFLIVLFEVLDAGGGVGLPDLRGGREGVREGGREGGEMTSMVQANFYPALLSLPSSLPPSFLTLAVVSSEQEARSVPVGSQATVFTSSVWPWRREGRREGGREGGE